MITAILVTIGVAVIWKAFFIACVGFAKHEALKDVEAIGMGLEINHSELTVRRMGVMLLCWVFLSVVAVIAMNFLDDPHRWVIWFWLPFLWGVFTHTFRHTFNKLRGRKGYLGIDSSYDRWWIRRGGDITLPDTSAKHWNLFEAHATYHATVVRGEHLATVFEASVIAVSSAAFITAYVFQFL